MKSQGSFFSRVLKCIAIFGLVPVLCAVQEPRRKPLPNIDQRTSGRPPAAQDPRVPEPGRAAAQARLKAQVPGVTVDFDPIVGSAKRVASTESWLTGAGGVGPSVPAVALNRYAVGDPHRVTKAFVDEHAGLFGHDGRTLEAARVKRDFTDTRTGLRTTVWEQALDGITIFEGIFISHLSKAAELVNVTGQFVPNPANAADRGHPGRAAGLRPGIAARQAFVLAARNVGDETEADATIAGGGPAGAEQRQQWRGSGVRGEADGRLVWLPTGPDSMRLCWEWILTSRTRGEMFRILIDSETGETLIRQGLTEYLTPVTYRVYTNESPTPFSPGHVTPLTNQPPVLARSLVVTSALDTNASPLGWINDGANETRGNNVDAHTDWDDNNTADVPRPQGSPARVFEAPLDFSRSPTNSSAAAVVQLFYYCNLMHDRLYQLGFTEAAGNFQINNFGRGGLGNDPVQADAQDGGGFNNANFATPPDGSSGRMQMYLWDGPNPARDGDFDGEIVFHEYGHGVSNRRVGGGVGLSALQSRGMGEGWSDFYGLALFAEPGDDVNGNWAAAAYSIWLDSGSFRQNYYFGLRRYPYTTDMARNPLTFKDIDPGRADPHTGIPRNPITSNFASEVHNQGEVWCVTLWDVRANLIARHGFEIGNELALKLVTDGMNLSPPNPTFLQARDGILQADRVLTGGANRIDLWQAFARRGMGFNAVAPASSTTSGVLENYDLPDDLSLEPRGGLTARGPVGGPFVLSQTNFTIRNVGTNPLAWAASAGSFLSLQPESGALPAGSPDAQVRIDVSAVAASLTQGTYSDALFFTNLTSGLVQRRTVTFLVGLPDYFTEVFNGNGDLENTTITFIPDGSPGFYRACAAPAAGFPTDPAGGTAVPLTDDSFSTVTLSGTAEVSLYGQRTRVVHIGSNGYLTFDEGDSSLSPTLATHFSQSRVSGLFEDLLPAAGTVTWKQLPDRMAVTFLNVQEFGASLTNSFQFELFYDGTLRLTWLKMNSRGGLIGLSSGAGVPANFAASDLSGYGACKPQLQVILPETVHEAGGTVNGRLRIPAPRADPLTVRLVSSAPSEITVPEFLTVPAGQTNLTFAATIVDDSVLDGSQNARVTASADGYQDASDVVTVHDNESATLQMLLPTEIPEGRGTISGAGRVEISAAPARDVLVTLLAVHPFVAFVPTPSVTIIPAGRTSAQFDLATVDNNVLDGPRLVRFIAHVQNWTDGTATTLVVDDDIAGLALAVPPEASESDGTLNGAGTIALLALATTNVVVTLASSDPTELTVPSTVIIPAGRSSATFALTVLDDDVPDGSQAVTITASAPGFLGTNTSFTIVDNEVPIPPYRPEPPTGSTNVALNASISWLSGEGEQIRNGDFESGDFRGWLKENTGPGDFLINSGTFDPESADGPLPPFAGSHSAISQQSGIGRHTLSQDVFIPSGATSARLSLQTRVRNFAAGFGPGQEFRVELRAPDDTVLDVPWRTQPGEPLLGDWTSRQFDLRSYRGQSLRVSLVEDDSRGFLNVHLDDVSLLVGTPAPSTFDVYFGTDANLGAAQFLGSTTNTSWPLPPLAPFTTYYWRIVARRGTTEAASPVWQFQTRSVLTVQPLVSQGSTWRYWDRGFVPGANWTTNDFDDRTWASGRARLGYGGDGEATTLNFGPDANNKFITTYFRQSFVVPDAGLVAALSTRLSRDDGAVIYLNGREAYRSNMPQAPTPISDFTLASTIVNAPEETQFYATIIAPGLLISGTNVVAVELHQSAGNSSDLGFDMDLIATAFGGTNRPPIITITNPVNYAVIRTPTNVTFGAEASDPDGTIVRVEFLVDGVRLLEDPLPPYRALWSGVQPGVHVLTAVATDNSGSSTVSAPVTVIAQAGQGVPLTLVPFRASWRYHDLGFDLGTTWRGTNYDDGLWAQGPAQLGYGDGDEATVVDYGPDINDKYPTTYFRYTFTNAASLSNLTLRVIRDDGVVVYLNEVEVLRNSMPGGPVFYSTFASAIVDNAAESTPVVTTLSPTNVLAGKNVLAVEIHQTSRTSSDISFDLELTALGNFPPSVSWVSPAPSSTFVLGQPIPLTASATDPYGDVARVDFFDGASLIGRVSSPPFALVWTNAPLGNRFLFATATDSQGATRPSSNIPIFVLPPPTLEATLVGQTIVLSWPVASTGFRIESASTLAPPIDWQPVTTVASRSDSRWSVVLTATNAAQFFRLSSPAATR